MDSGAVELSLHVTPPSGGHGSSARIESKNGEGLQVRPVAERAGRDKHRKSVARDSPTKKRQVSSARCCSDDAFTISVGGGHGRHCGFAGNVPTLRAGI